MTNDVIYVIYMDGKRMNSNGRKVAYLSEGAAKGVITSEVNYLVRYLTPSYFDMSGVEQNAAKAEIRKRYEIVEYAPKEERP
ncbi:hypothetical protein [Bacillus velezensis]|uniref:hypothetical protein n=1 Tax=Bacillus velezensis TaxID=492670 RepID=UPI00083DD417|nr:hypothetical protein [Bacillus velezensis]MEC1384408.1 hypothetical protein [Bacillus velezensis]ODB76046.1 hypothetical protein A7310_01915 [Bacillus velezensis]